MEETRDFAWFAGFFKGDGMIHRIIKNLEREKKLKRFLIHKNVFVERLLIPSQSAKTSLQVFDSNLALER